MGLGQNLKHVVPLPCAPKIDPDRVILQLQDMHVMAAIDKYRYHRDCVSQLSLSQEVQNAGLESCCFKAAHGREAGLRMQWIELGQRLDSGI